jgi:hypothetical protein
MSDVEPLEYGDRITIEHVGGQEQKVIFRGVFGNKYDQAYVGWPMAGEYKVKLDSGQLLPKNVSLWKVIDGDLARMRATSARDRADAKGRMKSNRAGGGRR